MEKNAAVEGMCRNKKICGLHTNNAVGGTKIVCSRRSLLSLTTAAAAGTTHRV